MLTPSTGTDSTSKNKLLDLSGLKYLLSKLSGKICLAVGTIDAEGDPPLNLKRTYTDSGILIHGDINESTTSQDGYFSAYNMCVFKKICSLVKLMYEYMFNDNGLKERFEILWEAYENGELGCKCITETTYEDPVVELSYPTMPAEGGTITPVWSFTQKWSDNKGGEGVITGSSDEPNEAAVTAFTSPKMSSYTGQSIDSETGAYTAPANTIAEDITLPEAVLQVTVNGKVGTAACAPVQEAALVTTYEAPEIVLAATDVSADGGKSYITYTFTQKWTDNKGGSGTITGGGGGGVKDTASEATYEVTYTANSEVVTMDDTGILQAEANFWSSRWKIATVKVTVTANGQSSEAEIDVYQEGSELVITYEEPTVELSYPEMPAEGGTIYPTYSYSQKWSGNDGSSGTITGSNEKEADGVTIAFNSPTISSFTGQSLDATTGAYTAPANTSTEEVSLRPVYIKVTLNGVSAMASATPVQAAAEEVTYTYETPTVELSCVDIPASGGTAQIQASFMQKWTGSDGTSGTIEGTYPASPGEAEVTFLSSYEAAGTDIVVDANGVVHISAESWSSRHKIATVDVTVTMNGKSATESIDVYQAAEDDDPDLSDSTGVTITYEAPVVELSYEAIPYGGGTVTPTYSYSQKWTGSDGSSGTIEGSSTSEEGMGEAEVSFNLDSAINGLVATSAFSSMGTVQQSNKSTLTTDDLETVTIGQVTITVTVNGVSGTATADVNQNTLQVTKDVSSEVYTLAVEGMISGDNTNLVTTDMYQGDNYDYETPGQKGFITKSIAIPANASLTLKHKAYDLTLKAGSAGKNMNWVNDLGVVSFNDGTGTSTAYVRIAYVLAAEGVDVTSLTGGVTMSDTFISTGGSPSETGDAAVTVAASDEFTIAAAQADRRLWLIIQPHDYFLFYQANLEVNGVEFTAQMTS